MWATEQVGQQREVKSSQVQSSQVRSINHDSSACIIYKTSSVRTAFESCQAENNRRKEKTSTDALHTLGECVRHKSFINLSALEACQSETRRANRLFGREHVTHYSAGTFPTYSTSHSPCRQLTPTQPMRAEYIWWGRKGGGGRARWRIPRKHIRAFPLLG